MSPGVAVTARNLWLAQAVHVLRPLVARSGLPALERVTVEAGELVPSQDGVPPNGRCWSSRTGPEGVPHIVINRGLSGGVRVLSVLLHELLHAADDCRSGHQGAFVRAVIAVGLEFNPDNTGTEPGYRLRHQLESMARRLGPYPKAAEGYLVTMSGRVWA